jgi:tetratricopeptide (TPR) repeat protein
MLIDRGLVVRDDGRWLATAPAAEVSVPESIESLIRARLDTLPREDRRLLQTASVVGRVFQRSAVAALEREDADLDRRLDEAVLRDLIIPERGLHSDPTYRFKHILVRDVAYAALPKARRAELHIGVADWLERWAGERRDEFVEIVAYHLEQAALLERELRGSVEAALEARAVEALMRSGTLALARDDLRVAERFGRRVLGLEPRDENQRLEAKWLVTDALLTEFQVDAAGQLGAELADEAAAHGRPDLRGRALLARATAEWLGPNAAGADVALRTLAEARRLLEQAGDLTYLFEAVFTIGFGAWADGRLDAAIAQWGQAVPIARSIPDAARQARVTLQIARCHALRGRLDLAIEHLDAGEELARRAGSRRMSLDAAGLRAYWVIAVRSLSEAVDALEALLPDIEEVGDLEARGMWHSRLADLHLMAGDLGRARAAAERALEISTASGHGGRIPEDEAVLAQILLDLGEIEEARPHADRALATAMEWDAHARASALAARGRVIAEQGQLDEAEPLLREAVSILEATEYRAQFHEVMTPLACFLLATGRSEEGEAWLARALESARRRGEIEPGEGSPLTSFIERAAAGARARAANTGAA